MNCAVVFVCIFAGVANAWQANTMMGNNMMGNNMMGNNMMGNNMMQNYGGNSGLSNLAYLLGMGGQQYQQQQGWNPNMGMPQWGNSGQKDSNNNNGMFSFMLGQMFMALLKQNSEKQQQQQPQYQQPWQPNYGMGNKDMEEIEEMLQKKMADEMVDMVEKHLKLRQKEEEYMMAVKFMCHMVEATMDVVKERNETVMNETMEAKIKQELTALKEKDDKEQVAWMIKKKMANPQEFDKVFFSIAAWNCKAAHEYKMATGKGDYKDECDGKDGDKEDEDKDKLY